MKNGIFILALIALIVLKAALIWSIWLMVTGTLALIGAMRVLWVWRSRPPGKWR